MRQTTVFGLVQRLAHSAHHARETERNSCQFNGLSKLFNHESATPFIERVYSELITHRTLSQMANACPSSRTASEPNRLQPDERKNESPSELRHPGLCIYCQTLVFNERDHFDTFEDHGYRLVKDDDGGLQLEINKDRFWDLSLSPYWSLGQGQSRLRTQLIRKDIVPSLPSFTATAEAGCPLCRCLLLSRLKDRCTTPEIMEHCETTSRENTVTIEFFYTWAKSSSCGIRKLVAAATIDGLGSRFAEYFLVEADLNDPCAEALGIPTNTYLPSWSFDEKMALMRHWIHDCEKSCHPESLDRTLPTRLLDLSSSRSPNQDIRLIHSKDIPHSGGCKYTALSHCWGSPDRPPLKTKTNSLDKMLYNIPFGSLPANYQDAVRVSRGLGIDYLWIDSLCIVQGSVEDWEIESLRMVDVYRQAEVTLIVATGNCCHDGFLDPKVHERVQIPYVSSLTDSRMKGIYYLRENYDTSTDIRNSPWNQRGWTLQENAFSTRRLYFTQNAISFSCDTHLLVMDGTRVNATWMQTVDSVSWYVDRKWDYHREWSNMTEQYTRRGLTYHQDRLPAISAWAQFLGKRLNDRYLAGLWESDLSRRLLWSCEAIPSTQTLAERIKFALKENFVAPSWSWASQTRGIHYRWRLTDEAKHYEILNIEVSPIGLNPFGTLKGGHMVISGDIRPLPVCPILRSTDCFQSTIDGGYQTDYYMDWWDKRMDVTYGQEIDREIVKDVKMLPLARCYYPNDATRGGTCGLLLLAAGSDEEYWRVGMLCIHHARLKSGWWREFHVSSKRRTIKIV